MLQHKPQNVNANINRFECPMCRVVAVQKFVLNGGSGSISEIVPKYDGVPRNVRYGCSTSGFLSQRVPASHQLAGTQLRVIAGISLNIRLFGDFERIIHFDAQIADRAFQLSMPQQ